MPSENRDKVKAFLTLVFMVRSRARLAHRILLLVSFLLASGASLFAEQGLITVSVLSYGAKDDAFAYSDKINVRDAPNTGAGVLKQLMTGDQVTIVERTAVRQALYGISDYWYKVTTAGQDGYVWGGLLAKSAGAADLEGAGSRDRILEQVFETYQVAVPVRVSRDYFEKSVLPKFGDPEKRKTLQHYYQAYDFTDGQTLDLVTFLGDGTVDNSPDITWSKQQIKDVSALMQSGGIAEADGTPDISFKRFGVSGRIQLKMLTAKRPPWEFAYAYPRVSASGAAENLVNAYGIGTPEEGSESRFNEGFRDPVVALLTGKGFTPPVVLLSISINAELDVSTFDQTTLFSFDGKGLSLVASYTAGWKGGGEGGRTDLIFPSDGEGEKNILAFKTFDIDSETGLVKFRWDGSRFGKIQQ